jgi:hypothetical protein
VSRGVNCGTRMKAADWFVRAVVTATFFTLLITPEKYGAPMVFISLVVVGAWVILYPQGVLGWVKAAHDNVDVGDSSTWWVPRLIGCVFLILAVLVGVAHWR